MRGRWPLRATGQQRSVDGDGDGDGDDHGHDGHAGPPEAHREGFGHALRGLRVANDGGWLGEEAAWGRKRTVCEVQL